MEKFKIKKLYIRLYHKYLFLSENKVPKSCYSLIIFLWNMTSDEYIFMLKTGILKQTDLFTNMSEW